MSISQFTSYPVVQLREIIKTLESGSRPSGGVSNFEDGIPSIGGEHISDNGGFDFTNIRYIPEVYFHQLSRGIIQTNDILLVKDGATTGKVAFVGEDFPFQSAAVNEHVFIIRADSKFVDAEYLFFFIYSSWGQFQIQRSFQGAAIGGINSTFIDRFEVPLPTLPEQHRIVEILRQADALRRLRGRSFDIFQKIAPAVYSEVFEGNEATHFVELAEIAEIASGVTKGRNFSGRETIEVPYLRVANVQAGYLDLSEIKTIQALPEDFEKYRLEFEDVLLTEGGDYDKLGRGALWESQIADCIHQNHIYRVRLDRKLLLPRFFAIYLQTSQPRAYFLRSAKRTTNIASINMSQLKKLPVPLPPMQLQERFVALLSRAEVVAKDNQRSVQKLSDLLTGLLYNAFRGDLTNGWRSSQSNRLADLAAQRDIVLGLRGEEPTLNDYERGRVTQAEREVIEQHLSDSLRPLLAQMAQYNPFSETLVAIQDSQARWAEQLAQIAQPVSFQLPAFEIRPLFSDAVSNAMFGVQNRIAALADDNRSAMESVTNHFASIASMIRSINETFAASFQPVTLQLTTVIENLARAIDEWPPRDHPRFDVIVHLNRSQKLILFTCERQKKPFTVEAIQEELGLSQESIRRALDLFASLGLLASVSVPGESADGSTFVTAYRSSGQSDDVRLTDLAMLTEPGQA